MSALLRAVERRDFKEVIMGTHNNAPDESPPSLGWRRALQLIQVLCRRWEQALVEQIRAEVRDRSTPREIDPMIEVPVLHFPEHSAEPEVLHDRGRLSVVQKVPRQADVRPEAVQLWRPRRLTSVQELALRGLQVPSRERYATERRVSVMNRVPVVPVVAKPRGDGEEFVGVAPSLVLLAKLERGLCDDSEKVGPMKVVRCRGNAGLGGLMPCGPSQRLLHEPMLARPLSKALHNEMHLTNPPVTAAAGFAADLGVRRTT